MATSATTAATSSIPTDLIEPRSRIDGTTPVFEKTKHLFLDLPAFKEQLTSWIESQEHWRPNVRRFSLNFVKELKPRAITRDLDWGVPIPVAGYEELSEKRIYVWFDAVIGYLSASIEWASNRGTPDAWREWWQSPEAEHTYFMGKDNIVFHTVIWPSMLLGYGEGGEYGAGRAPLELPDNVASSEFLTMEGKKFSSSRGVQILVRDFLSRYDPDALRYFLSIAGPETQDTDFTWSEFVRRNNDELVATWGNLVNRTLQSAYKNFGVVPTPGALTDADGTLLADVEGGFDTVGSLIEEARFKNALQETMRLAGLVNQYIAEQAPWSLIESDRERAGTILYVALRAIDNLKILLTPYPPVLVAAPPRASRLRRPARRPDRAARRDRGGRRGAHGSDGRVRVLDRSVGAERAHARAGAARAGAPVREARPRARSCRRSSGGWRQPRRRRPRPPKRLPPRDGHACAPRRVRGRGRGDRERAEPRESGGSSPSARGSTRRRAALDLADRHEGVYAVLGIDPHQASSPEADRLDELRELLGAPECGRRRRDGPRQRSRARDARRPGASLRGAARARRGTRAFPS